MAKPEKAQTPADDTEPATEPAPDLVDASTPAEEARQEAVDEKPKPYRVEFRGVEFLIDPDVFGSFRLLAAVAQGNLVSMVTEIIEPADLPRLMALSPRGEPAAETALEFLGAVNTARGWTKDPNS